MKKLKFEIPALARKQSGIGVDRAQCRLDNAYGQSFLLVWLVVLMKLQPLLEFAD